MFGKRLQRAESEIERLTIEIQRSKKALEHQQSEYSNLMEQQNKLREKYTHLANAKLYGAVGFELARQAVDLIRYGPLFASTDPAVPVYTRQQVEQGCRRILAELEA